MSTVQPSTGPTVDDNGPVAGGAGSKSAIITNSGGTSGNAGVGDSPPYSSNDPTAPRIRPGMSSPKLSASPDSVNPEPPPPIDLAFPGHHGYYVSTVFPRQYIVRG